MTERDGLVAEIHAANLFNYDNCTHGTYSGGAQAGEPFAMCERFADSLLRSDWLASVRGSARVHPTQDEITKALDIELARDENWHPKAKMGLEVGASERLADAILALLSSTPTVAQARAVGVIAGRESMREEAAMAAGKVAYIRDWDGYTVDDAAYQVRSEAADSIRAIPVSAPNPEEK